MLNTTGLDTPHFQSIRGVSSNDQGITSQGSSTVDSVQTLHTQQTAFCYTAEAACNVEISMPAFSTFEQDISAAWLVYVWH